MMYNGDPYLEEMYKHDRASMAVADAMVSMSKGGKSDAKDVDKRQTGLDDKNTTC